MPVGIRTEKGFKQFDTIGAGTPESPMRLVVTVGERATPRIPTLTRTSLSGTVLFGACSVTVANVGSLAGSLMNVALAPGESVTFTAPLGDILNAITYDATGTVFLVGVVR